MPPALKKRKIAAATTCRVAPATHQQCIASFGRISKSGSGTQIGKAEKDDAFFDEPYDLHESKENFTKKRKIELLETPPKEENCLAIFEKKPAGVTKSDKTSSTIQASSPTLPALPIKPRKRPAIRPKNAETPTKGARAFLEAFALSSSSPSSLRSSPLPVSKDIFPASSTPISILSPDYRESCDLPEELQDLIRLHSSFLTALSLHYAHNGRFTPTELRLLQPSIERAWGKRRICIEDVQLILGILGTEKLPIKARSPIVLSDYGNGKICVELIESSPQDGMHRQPIETEKLKARFEANMRRLWEDREPCSDIPSFLSYLTPCPISVCSSLSQISPLLAKGQRRLEDLKAGAIKAQVTANSNKSSLLNSPTRLKAVSNRSSSLLSRIQAKELYQSTLPGTPSPEAIARRNALQRLEEVMPVLDILTSSGTRSVHTDTTHTETNIRNQVFSFTMPTIVQHLQMSLRNPISKDEAMKCIGMLADEIAPAWIGLKKIGKLNGVTIRRVKGMSRDELTERIRNVMRKA